MEPIYLLYIGKSNKRFTYNKVYVYLNYYTESNDFFISVYTDKKILVNFRNEHFDYFYKNFKFINDQELIKLRRKIKINKINKK